MPAPVTPAKPIEKAKQATLHERSTMFILNHLMRFGDSYASNAAQALMDEWTELFPPPVPVPDDVTPVDPIKLPVPPATS